MQKFVAKELLANLYAHPDPVGFRKIVLNLYVVFFLEIIIERIR